MKIGIKNTFRGFIRKYAAPAWNMIFHCLEAVLWSNLDRSRRKKTLRGILFSFQVC